MQLLFHTGPLDEFLLLMPLMRAMPRPMTVIAPWQRTSLAATMIGTLPMDIELFEFTRLHTESGPTRISPAIKDLFESATLVLSFLGSEHDAWAKNVKRFAPKARLILTDPRPSTDAAMHFTDWHAATLAEKGLLLKPIEPAVRVNHDGPIVIHPGSSAIKRCWPIERYEELVTALRQRGLQVRPVLGEVEQQRWSPDRYKHWTEHMGAELFRSADALLPVLRVARLFIGNDAGPLHLSAESGTQTLGVFGPTDPKKRAPRGEHFHFVGPSQGPGRIEEVPLSAVINAVGLE